jgi:hypothetical protein
LQLAFQGLKDSVGEQRVKSLTTSQDWTMEFTCRFSPITKGKTFILGADCLTIFSKGKIERTLPYNDILIIQLYHNPSKHDWKVYICEITSRHGKKYRLCNKSYPGIVPKDKSDEYIMFVEELHRRVSAMNQNVEYIGGQKSKTYYIVMIGAMSFFLGLGIILSIYARYAVFVGLIIVITWLIWLTWTLIKNRPVKYNPLDIPPRLLPK